MFDVDGEATQCIEQAITVVVRYPDDKWQAAWVSAGAIESDMKSLNMAVILKLKCPDCAETFKWPGDQKWPDFCPLCRAQLSTHADEICMPFISSARAKSPDQVYRQMEAGAEVRAQAASENFGSLDGRRVRPKDNES